jgi:hypothetical protein
VVLFNQDGDVTLVGNIEEDGGNAHDGGHREEVPDLQLARKPQQRNAD